MSAATIGALRVVLGLDSAAFTDGLNAAQRQLRQAGARLEAVGRNMAVVGAGLTATITAPLIAFGVRSHQAAADAEELQSAFDFSFGEMAGQMNDWAVATGDALGRSTQAIQQAAFTFNQLFSAATPVAEVSSELSQRFAVLAQDLASFYNVAEDDALMKLRAGLVGEAEPLRAFGVFLTSASVEARAFEMGLADANGELTEQAKILARAELIYEATTAAQGDLLRTQDSATNQGRALAAVFEEISVTVGQMLLPIITPLVQRLNGLLQSFSNLSPQMQQVIVIGAAIAAALGPVLIVAGALVASLGALLPVIGAIGAPLLAAAAAAAAVGAALYVFRDDLIPIVESFAQSVAENIGPKLAPLWEALKGAVMAVGEVFSLIFSDGSPDGAVATLKTWGEWIARVFGAAMELITGALNVITNLFRAFGALLRGDFSAMWSYLGAAVMSAVRGIVGAFTTLFPEVSAWVQRTYEAVREWLLQKFADIVRGIGEKVGQVIGFFRDLWDAVVGHSYIPDMVTAIAEWMGPRLQDAMVDPARSAIDETTDAFGGMTETIDGQLEGLFRSISSKDWKGALGGLFDIFADQGGVLGSLGSIGGAILGALPGFQTGGSFRVGGSGGPDSQLTAFRATPGEMVDIRNPGQGVEGGAVVVHVQASEYFDARVERVAAPLVVQGSQMAVGGAQSAMAGDMAQSQKYAWK